MVQSLLLQLVAARICNNAVKSQEIPPNKSSFIFSLEGSHVPCHSAKQCYEFFYRPDFCSVGANPLGKFNLIGSGYGEYFVGTSFNDCSFLSGSRLQLQQSGFSFLRKAWDWRKSMGTAKASNGACQIAAGMFQIVHHIVWKNTWVCERHHNGIRFNFLRMVVCICPLNR